MPSQSLLYLNTLELSQWFYWKINPSLKHLRFLFLGAVTGEVRVGYQGKVLHRFFTGQSLQRALQGRDHSPKLARVQEASEQRCWSCGLIFGWSCVEPEVGLFMCPFQLRLFYNWFDLLELCLFGQQMTLSRSTSHRVQLRCRDLQLQFKKSKFYK